MFWNKKLTAEDVIDYIYNNNNNVNKFRLYEIYDLNGEKELKKYLKNFKCKEKVADKIILKDEILDSHNGFYRFEIMPSLTPKVNLINIIRVSDGKCLESKLCFMEDYEIECKTIEKKLKLTKEIKKWLES